MHTRVGERWIVDGGLRVDTQTYDGSDDGEQWSPRVSVLYTLSPQTHLRASLGRFVQFQGINELQVEDGVDTFYGAQHAHHAIVGFDHSFDDGLDLRVEAFRKEYRHINPRFENMFDPLVLVPEAEFDRVRDRAAERARDRCRADAAAAPARFVERLAELQLVAAWTIASTATMCRAAGINDTP